MTDWRLIRSLVSAAIDSHDPADGGAVGVSVATMAGAEPFSYWEPESHAEPAFLAYSITKTFTATQILMLCDAGRLSLHDRLATWFPRVDRAEKISVHQLLNHTAGIPDYGGLRAYHDAVHSTPSEPWSFGRFAAETFDRGLLFEPGTGWAYSNPGYMLLKRIVEDVDGRLYRDAIAERITRPLGLHRTFVAESIADLAGLAAGTSRALGAGGAPCDVRMHYHPGWVSHGVIASTPSDIVRFLDALFRGRLLRPESLARMTELVAVPVARNASAPSAESRSPWVTPSYGLGLMADPDSRWGLVLGHNGGGPCYSASAFYAPGLGGASVCVMGAMEEHFSAEEIVVQVLDHLAGRDRV
ncbi:MAG TPA: serine hydrolase domain-containing protein [Gemmatimonadaceae bacterium]|nr:serine hydrolase domain-containing protein [Gemmatimonadaceae bacterium]